jgi:sugar phosphate isomerase/epimerase
MNMVQHESKMSWFNNDWNELAQYLKAMKLDGTELIFHQDYKVDQIPQDLAVGIHMTYWPTWLDFWHGNHPALEKQFLNLENVDAYYGGASPQAMIDKYRLELETARALNMEYAVIHVSHVEVEDTFTWKFDYTNQDVLCAAADFINEAVACMPTDVALLFENLWWPGLNFLDVEHTLEFFEKIHYPNKGFMLDIGHLMITNPRLRSLEEAGAYIQSILEQNCGLLPHIRGIHLNQALTGEYIMEDHGDRLAEMKACNSYWDMLGKARGHIGRIDQHTPFDHPSIRDIVAMVDPEYLIYEFLPENREVLTKMIQIQHQALGF